MLNYNKKLDVRTLSCPLPLLKVKRSMLSLQHGDVLYVITDNNQSVQDLNYFATFADQSLIHFYKEGKDNHFYFIKN